MYRKIQICVLLAAFAFGMDPLESTVWVEIPADDRDFIIKTAADLLAAKSAALTLDTISCADTATISVKIKIQADCISCTAEYNNIFLPRDTLFLSWAPDLSTLVEQTCAQIKTDMVDLLTDLAAVHFDGATSGGGVRYVITTRN